MTNKKNILKHIETFVSILTISIFAAGLAGFGIFINTNEPATANAAGETIDMKFSVDGVTWLDDLTGANAIAPGTNVLTRLYYNNPSDTPVNGASIGAVLPSGFTYNSSSLYNCMTPDLADPAQNLCSGVSYGAQLSDSLFTGQTLAMSPVAGLYDAADAGASGTAVTATSGIFEIGKKRYHNEFLCNYTSNGLFTDIKTPDNIFERRILNFTNEPATSHICGGPAWYTPPGNPPAIMNPVEMRGQRYLHQRWCNFFSPSTLDNGDTAIMIEKRVLGINNASTMSSSCEGAQPASWTVDPSTTPAIIGSYDQLGNRYYHELQCNYTSTGLLNDGSSAVEYIRETYAIDNTASYTSTGCAPIAGYNVFFDGIDSQDMLDQNRGAGYIEFQMTASSPITTETFSISSDITGGGLTGVNNSGSIEVTATDSDNDGLSDGVEAMLNTNPNLADSDGDGVNDLMEVGSDTNNPTDTDSDGIIDALESSTADTDNDGVMDQMDPANNDPCDPNNLATVCDTDNDGLSDGQEAVLNTNPNVADTDGDGVSDLMEVGSDTNNPTDTDSDGIIDALESSTMDSDNDGVMNQMDTANNDPCDPDNIKSSCDFDNDGISDLVEVGSNPNSPTDSDSDGIPDYKEVDSDNDGILDSVEVGDNVSSPVDTDNDGTPDFQDTDSDGDGLSDLDESGNNGTIGDPIDTDTDGIPDYLDPDSDNDTIPDSVESPLGGAVFQDSDNDGVEDQLDKDSDNDGIPDSVEVGSDPLNPVDTDNDGTPDFQDSDSDGDGTNDVDEAGSDSSNPVDSDGDNIPDVLESLIVDSDGDGIVNQTDAANDNPCDPSNRAAACDTDGDGVSDGEELFNGTNPNSVDSDSDGLTDSEELTEGTDANKSDTDGDGLSDGAEVNIHLTDPLLVDTDGDGLSDFVEIAGATSPLTKDTDGDGIQDGQENTADNTQQTQTTGLNTVRTGGSSILLYSGIIGLVFSIISMYIYTRKNSNIDIE